ncbi:MAG: hypothetical protein K0S08_1219 [Gammaproteobacteria bacterium]|jgi:hypothetical protein|nr:hypothetical protein [Gammaproteobacteria bacterium]
MPTKEIFSTAIWSAARILPGATTAHEDHIKKIAALLYDQLQNYQALIDPGNFVTLANIIARFTAIYICRLIAVENSLLFMSASTVINLFVTRAIEKTLFDHPLAKAEATKIILGDICGELSKKSHITEAVKYLQELILERGNQVNTKSQKDLFSAASEGIGHYLSKNYFTLPLNSSDQVKAAATFFGMTAGKITSALFKPLLWDRLKTPQTVRAIAMPDASTEQQRNIAPYPASPG